MKEENKTERKNEALKSFTEGSAIFACCMGGMAMAAALIGGGAQLASELAINTLEKDVTNRQEFKDYVTLKRFALIDRLNRGEVTAEEFAYEYKRLDSDEIVIDYAFDSGDEKLVDMAVSYNQTKEYGDGIVEKGLPTMLGGTAVGAGTYALASFLKKKYTVDMDNPEDGLDLEK